MLFNVLARLVIRFKVTLTDDTSRGLEVPREHTTRCTPHLAGYVTGPMPNEKEGAPEPNCVLLLDWQWQS